MFVTLSDFYNNRWGILFAGTGSHAFNNTLVDNNLAVNVTGKDNVFNYNRVVVPHLGKALFNFGENTDADYNWWGQNNLNGIVYNITLQNWFVMYVQKEIPLQHFVNPGEILSYTYIFELNTKDPFNPTYLPIFYVDLDINGKTEKRLATGGPYRWNVLFSDTNYYYMSATLDHEISGFNVNNYSTRLTIGDFSTIKGQNVTLNATLTDAYGTPMVNRMVHFYVDAIRVGTAYTDLDGFASFNYKATRAGVSIVNAYFVGDTFTVPYYIVDPPLTGIGWYHGNASATSNLYVGTGNPIVTGNFDLGHVQGANLNMSATAGSNFNFLYTVKNSDPAAIDLVVKFVIPSGLKYVKAIAFDHTGFVTRHAAGSKIVFDKKTNTLTWYITGLRYGDASIDITLNPTKDGKYVIKPVITPKSKNVTVKTAGTLTINAKAKKASTANINTGSNSKNGSKNSIGSNSNSNTGNNGVNTATSASEGVGMKNTGVPVLVLLLLSVLACVALRFKNTK
jgi:hypothetical protein